MQKITLANGHALDLVGTGTNTFGKINHEYTQGLSNDLSDMAYAIQAGYRLFDTAVSYRTEPIVGQGLANSALARDQFFITTKFPGRDDDPKDRQNEARIRQIIDQSFANLQTDRIDLYLLHHPWKNHEDILRVWRVLESYVNAGRINSLGVSNYDQELLEFLMAHARIQPVLNQIESHPGRWNDDLIVFTQAKGLVAQAWGPLTNVAETSREALSEIGQKYRKSWAQVALKYNVQRQVAVIPKSHQLCHQEANLDIFDFTLSAEDLAHIQKL